MHEFADNEIPETQLAVEHLMAADEAQFENAAVDFVIDRVGDLTYEAPRTDGPIHRYQGPHDVFLGHETEVRPMPEGTGFYVDDANTYMLTLKHMRELRDPEGAALSRTEYVGRALQAVQAMEGEYFDNLQPSEEQGLIRNLAMLQGAIPGSPYVRPSSISELKDVALCTERAALAHNSLKILGVRSKLIFGGMEVEGKKFAHTFVEVEDGQNGSMIFDPMNPWLTINESRELIGVEPSVTPLPEVSDGSTAVESGMKLRVQIGGETREAEQACTYLFELGRSAEDDRKTQEMLAKLALLD
jgi:hypothetical protein